MTGTVDFSKLTDEQLKAVAMGQAAPSSQTPLVHRAPTWLDDPGQILGMQIPGEVNSRLVKMGRGMNDLYQGTKQKYLNWTDPQAAAQYTQGVNAERATYEQGRKDLGESGFDGWRFAGNVATPLAAAPGGAASLGARTLIGGLLGGSQGYMDFSESNTATSNLVKTGVGAAAGGLLNAAVPPLMDAGMKGLQWVGNKVMEGGRTAAQALVPGMTNNITNEIKISLQSKGIDWSKLAPEMQATILDAGKEQLAKTGTLDAAMLARKADIETIAGPGMGTLAQITRDPAQWSVERNLQKTEVNLPQAQEGQLPITSRLQTQDQKMKDFGAGIAEKAAGNTPAASRAGSPFQAAENAFSAVKKVHKDTGEEVSALYDIAEKTLGAQSELPVGQFSQRVTQAMQDFADVLPSPIVERLNAFGFDRMGPTKATRAFTVEEGNALLKLVNKRYASANPETQAALDEVRGALKGALGEAGNGGNDAAKRFMEAISGARERFAQFEPPSINAIVKGKANPTNFLETKVLNGNPNELAAFRDLIVKNEGSASWNDIRGQVWQWAMDKATSNGKGPFSGAALHDAVKKIGPDRMKVLFPDELPQIMTLVRGSMDMTHQPHLSAVNHANTAPALVGQLMRLGNRIPFVNMVTAPIEREVQNSVTTKLINQALDSTGATDAVRNASQAQARQRVLEGLLLGRSGYPALAAPGLLDQYQKQPERR